MSALSEWVISKNQRGQDNIAAQYLDDVQSHPAMLNTVNQTIKKYNQALLYCQQDSTDLAVIQLKKALIQSKACKSTPAAGAFVYPRPEI